MANSAPETMDILSVVFFAVAGAWLVAALFYSFMALIFLRMRSRGQLGSMYDEDFGRIKICGNCHLRVGWLFRRYARHLHIEEAEEGLSGPNASSVRFMTREERRAAIETLLLTASTTDSKDKQQNNKQEHDTERSDESESSSTPCEVSARVQEDEETGDAPVSSTDDESSIEGPMCSICLGGYENDERVFEPKTCSHHFHEDCILDWLQRNGKTECPCCRVAMVSEDDVWGTVKKLRKAKKKELRRERRKLGRKSSSNSEEAEVSETEEYDDSYEDEEMGTGNNNTVDPTSEQE